MSEGWCIISTISAVALECALSKKQHPSTIPFFLPFLLLQGFSNLLLAFACSNIRLSQFSCACQCTREVKSRLCFLCTRSLLAPEVNINRYRTPVYSGIPESHLVLLAQGYKGQEIFSLHYFFCVDVNSKLAIHVLLFKKKINTALLFPKCYSLLDGSETLLFGVINIAPLIF